MKPEIRTFEGLAEKVVLIELDSDVAAVWQTILGDGGEWRSNRIYHFKLTAENARQVLRSRPRDARERAFATVLRNRLQRGGILAPGAGLMKYGENGKGLRSRWYPETLRRRIMDIVGVREKIRIVHGEGVKFLEKCATRKGAAFFIDPPYVVAGRRLYRHSDVDHEKLFALARRLEGDFLFTYDDSEEIRKLVGAIAT